MAHATAPPAETPVDRGELARPTVQALPVTPGKVAMWLFLATEVMFFTGLIGSYVVLRAGSPPTAYSNLYPPATDLSRLGDTRGVLIERITGDEHRVVEAVRGATGLSEYDAEKLVERLPTVVKAGMTEAEAASLRSQLEAAGAAARVEELRTANWPKPYDTVMNPLSIDLTAVNTFFLICSSVTMVLALSAIQRGNQRGLVIYLLCTVAIGTLFVGIQGVEYWKLSTHDRYSIGVSANGHFIPSASLFASCFFTMTGFHGAHVTGGVILLTCILIQSMRGVFTRAHHSAVELAGLYWHFVDLVWIILFTVVYLV
jgi:cytochrome c oxidase subunit III